MRHQPTWTLQLLLAPGSVATFADGSHGHALFNLPAAAIVLLLTLRLIVWLAIGLVLYFSYGQHHATPVGFPAKAASGTGEP